MFVLKNLRDRDFLSSQTSRNKRFLFGPIGPNSSKFDSTDPRIFELFVFSANIRYSIHPYRGLQKGCFFGGWRGGLMDRWVWRRGAQGRVNGFGG